MNTELTHNVLENEESFEKLALLFGEKSSNNLITIPPEKGEGIIKKFKIVDGLYIIIWDLQLRHTLQWKRLSQDDSQESSSLFYVFTDNSFHLLRDTTVAEKKEALKNIVFISGNVDLTFLVTPLLPVRAVEIIISDEWLASEYVSNNLSTYAFYNTLLNKKKPLLFTEQASLSIYHSFLNVYRHVNISNPDSAFARTKTLSLLSEIFISFGKRHDIKYKKNLVTEEKMIGIEKIMDDHLSKTLPSICDIAKQLALSESTLKRNFKALYGTSIYEYYLKKKMQKAKQLFDDNHVTVKEVAYMLGYEKVSNFITIFKKYHVFSPGHLKKSQRAASNSN